MYIHMASFNQELAVEKTARKKRGAPRKKKASANEAVLRVLKAHGRNGCKRSQLGVALVARYKASARDRALAGLVASGVVKKMATGGKGSGRVGRPGEVFVYVGE